MKVESIYTLPFQQIYYMMMKITGVFAMLNVDLQLEKLPLCIMLSRESSVKCYEICWNIILQGYTYEIVPKTCLCNYLVAEW